MVTQPLFIYSSSNRRIPVLGRISMKDIIALADKNGNQQLYQVEAIDIVDDVSNELPIYEDNSPLTLITCNSFNGKGANKNERYVITAKKL